MTLTLGPAADLGAKLQDAADSTGLDVMVTTDTVAAESQVSAGNPAIVINPPVITCETYHAVDMTWQVWIITGPPTNRVAAWERLDQLIDAIRVPVDVDQFEPAAFQPAQGPVVPAYIATITTPQDL